MLMIRSDQKGTLYGVGYLSKDGGHWEQLFHTKSLIKACELVSWLNGGERPPLDDVLWNKEVSHG